jgi:hypothetical protein
MMLPFFLIGVAIPVYFFGFSGDGPPKIAATNTYEPPAAMAPAPDGAMPPGARSYERAPRSGIVEFMRGLFENAVDTYVAPGLPPILIKLGMLLTVFVAGFIVIRLILGFISGTLGSVIGFLIHKAAGPMFMGFLAVGSTWGIHQTIAQQFGLEWAATTVSLTAAVATLFALAGVRIRA